MTISTLNVAAKARLVVSLTDSGATGFAGTAATVFAGAGGFAAIDRIEGSADTLRPNVASTWI